MILTNIDLKTLIEQHTSVRLVKRATTGGGEYWSSCPWCEDGQNRFHVWPYHSTRPHYWCRVCGRSGDAIAFIQDWLDLDLYEACEMLGVDLDQYERFKSAPERVEYPLKAPCKGWQITAEWLVEQGEYGLWKTPEGRTMLEYLVARGLDTDLISERRLGFIPLKNGKWLEMPFSAWGLTEAMLTPEQWAQGCVKIPDGILIPWYINGELWKLSIKRPGGAPNYWQILGSVDALYNADALSVAAPAMLVEGEFDALSVMQEASDVVACVATGSVSKGRDLRWLAQLGQSSVVLQSFDADEAGAAGADWWSANLQNVQRWRPTAHDPNDMLREQKDIRRWVRKGLMIASMSPVQAPEIPLQPLARVEDRTIDQPVVQPSSASYIPKYTHWTPSVLGRKHCPHQPCYKGVPGPRGWCAEHSFVLEQLDMGQMLGYPEISIGMHYFISKGKPNWEAHAERTLRKRHERIMGVLKWHYEQMYDASFPHIDRAIPTYTL